MLVCIFEHSQRVHYVAISTDRAQMNSVRWPRNGSTDRGGFSRLSGTTVGAVLQGTLRVSCITNLSYITQVLENRLYALCDAVCVVQPLHYRRKLAHTCTARGSRRSRSLRRAGNQEIKEAVTDNTAVHSCTQLHAT